MKSKREREPAERPARTEEKKRKEKEKFLGSPLFRSQQVAAERSTTSASFAELPLSRRPRPRRRRFSIIFSLDGVVIDSPIRIIAPHREKFAKHCPLPAIIVNLSRATTKRATRAAVIPENRDGGREKWQKVSLYKIGRRMRASDMDDGGRQSRDRSQDIQSLC